MICNVKDSGAAGDGKTNDSAALQKAIDTCSHAGGGKVVVPPGEYLVATLYMKSNVELHLTAGAKLRGEQSPDCYDDFKADGFKSEFCAENTARVLLAASYCENISITGQGEINGSGPAFYDTANSGPEGVYAKPPIKRPRMVMFFRCKNVKLEDSSYMDSPCWTIWLIACEQVNIRGIKVIGDQKMINNDGIDIDSCRNVAISDCFIKTGDDCLILRAIQQVQDQPAICENVAVSNCVLDSWCQGIRVGCPGDNIIRNCAFSNIVFDGRGSVINVDNPKRYLPENSGTRLDLTNIMFSNFIVDSGRYPVRINVEEGVKLRKISGLVFSNFRGKSAKPCLISGSSETIVENIKFSNFDITSEESSPIVCRNARNVRLNDEELTGE